MATVNRPPFWVPRPPDDYYWDRQTPKRSWPIEFLSQQKIYGAGGQVPTKRWVYWIIDNDPPPWYPLATNLEATQRMKFLYSIPVNLVRAPLYYPRPASEEIWIGQSIGVFGKRFPSGQNPFSFQLRWPYSYDETAQWVGSSTRVSYALLSINPPGSTIAIPFIFKGMDEVVWYPLPETLNMPQTLLLTQPTGRVIRWNWTYDETAPWQFDTNWMTSSLIQILSSQKIYGQGGQVPPFRWNWTYDETPPWQWPQYERNLNLLTSYSVIPFRWNYTYDDPPPWQIDNNSMSSAVIQILSQPKIYGQGGQVPPFRWNYTFDDSSLWQGTQLRAASLTLTTVATFYGAPGQVPPFRWNWTYDETAPWQWPNYSRNQNLTTSYSVVPFRWNYTYDDPPPWQFDINWMTSSVIQILSQPKIYGQGGQVPPFRWNYTYDDPPPWLAQPIGSRSLYITPTATFYGQPGQVPPFRWNATYDDSSLWTGTPQASRAIPLTTLQTKYYGQPGQVVPFRWNYTYDDPPPWQWPLYVRNPNVYGIPPPAPFSNTQSFRWTIDDASLWTGTPLPSKAIGLTTLQTKFYGQPGQVVPFRWNYTYDDPPPWQWSIATNRIILQPVQSPFSNTQSYRWTIDDASLWTGTPLSSKIVGFQVPFSNTQSYRWTFDDPPVWTGSPIRSAIITLLSAQRVYGQGGQVPPFRWNWGLNEPPEWVGASTRSYTIQLLNTQLQMFGAPGQVQPRFWRFDYNDASYWNWPTTEINFPLYISIFVPPPPPAAQVMLTFGTVSQVRISGSVTAFLPEGSVRMVRTGGTVTDFGPAGAVDSASARGSVD